MSAADATIVIVASGVVGLLFATLLLWMVAQITLDGKGGDEKKELLADNTWWKDIPAGKECVEKMEVVYDAVTEGASAFLMAEYK